MRTVALYVALHLGAFLCGVALGNSRGVWVPLGFAGVVLVVLAAERYGERRQK